MKKVYRLYNFQGCVWLRISVISNHASRCLMFYTLTEPIHDRYILSFTLCLYNDIEKG